jgi:hypothetical protein
MDFNYFLILKILNKSLKKKINFKMIKKLLKNLIFLKLNKFKIKIINKEKKIIIYLTYKIYKLT